MKFYFSHVHLFFVTRLFRHARLITFSILILMVASPLTWAAPRWNLGMVEPSPSLVEEQLTPFMNYLRAKGLNAEKIITAKSIDEMVGLFAAGKVDFYIESAYGALKVMDATGAQPILVREKKGVREHQAVIFVREDSPIKSMGDLKGKVIAFEDPASTSSFVMPMVLLKKAGLVMVESATAVPNSVAYYFSGDDDNTLLQVKKGGKADAGGTKKAKLKDKPGFRILDPESLPVPRQVVLVRKGLDAGSLSAILQGMNTDPAAKESLDKAEKTTGFYPFNGNPATVMGVHVRDTLGL